MAQNDKSEDLQSRKLDSKILKLFKKKKYNKLCTLYYTNHSISIPSINMILKSFIRLDSIEAVQIYTNLLIHNRNNITNIAGLDKPCTANLILLCKKYDEKFIYNPSDLLEGMDRYLSLDSPLEAIGVYDFCSKERPRAIDINIHNKAILLYLKESQYEKAFEIYSKQGDDISSNNRYKMMRALLKTGFYEEALKIYAYLSPAELLHFPFHITAIKAFQGLGENTNGMRVYEDIRCKYDNQITHHNLAMEMCVNLRKPEIAIAIYNSLSDEIKNFGVAYPLVMLAYNLKSEFNQGMKIYNEFIAPNSSVSNIAPYDKNIYTQILDCIYSQEKYAEFLRLYATLKEDNMIMKSYNIYKVQDCERKSGSAIPAELKLAISAPEEVQYSINSSNVSPQWKSVSPAPCSESHLTEESSQKENIAKPIDNLSTFGTRSLPSAFENLSATTTMQGGRFAAANELESDHTERHLLDIRDRRNKLKTPRKILPTIEERNENCTTYTKL